MKPQRLFQVGALLGLALGLLYTWKIEPVQYYDTYPPLMQIEYRADWIRMTALACGQEGSLERARVRLRNLPPEEVRREVGAALDAAVAGGRPLPVLQRMAMLAQTYGVDSPAVQIYLASGEEVAFSTPLPPQPSPTPSPTSLPPTPVTPPPLMLPTPTPLPPPYLVEETLSSCLPEPRIAVSITQEVTVTVQGSEQLERQGLPGVEVWLLWADGADRAVTGLRPAQGLGYADFAIEPGETYNLYLDSPTGAPIATLLVQPCTGGEGHVWSSWLLILQSTRGGVER